MQNTWPNTPGEAVDLQNRLRMMVICQDTAKTIDRIAGIDVSFPENGQVAQAAIIVLRAADLALVDAAIARRPMTLPYIPGLLSFREAPAIMDALNKLTYTPELLIFDGHGLAHPRRFGLACHLGILSGLPSIGAAKSRLIGEHAVPGETKGEWVPLTDKGDVIGAVLRTRNRTKPIYVSIGHRMSLETAVQHVLNCTTKYRLPEPTRLAHQAASGRLIEEIDRSMRSHPNSFIMGG